MKAITTPPITTSANKVRQSAKSQVSWNIDLIALSVAGSVLKQIFGFRRFQERWLYLMKVYDLQSICNAYYVAYINQTTAEIRLLQRAWKHNFMVFV